LNKTKLVLVEHTSIDIKRSSDYLWTILGLTFCEKIVYLTQIEHDEARETFKYFFNPNKTEIIANGVDLNKFSPKIEKSDDKLIIVKHCRFVKSKDLETLIKGFALLKKMPVSQKIELKLAGDGDVMKILRELVRELALEQEVIFTGLLTEDEIVELLKSADIYVNTSKAETLSTSIIQAMACGLPCIASDIIENKTLVKEKKTGRLFEVSNQVNLAQVLFEICGDPVQRKLLGTNARSYVEENFSNQLMIAKYKKMIDKIL
jgi:glycosyltransferase involved in cell wall biosynthesis